MSTRCAAMALVLCCCARVATQIPSSLPSLVVDESLAGPVLSVEAARVVLKQRANAKAAAETAAAESEKKIRVLTMQRDGAERFAHRNAFWGMWGPTIAVSSGVGGAVLSALVFLVVWFGGFAHGK